MRAASPRADLHDALARHAFDHAVICTFTFEPQFFEDYCLDRFKALAENNNISVLVDRRIYDELIEGPASEWPRQANVRYLLHPIGVPGTFHPKLFLLANRDKGLLIVGSANFTKAGLTSNGELVGVYRYERGKSERHLGMFKQAAQFINALAGRWPSDDLDSNLSEMFAEAPWLTGDSPTAPGSPRLLHNLDLPLWPQVSATCPAPVDALHVISRYFDAVPTALTRVQETARPRRTVLWTQNGRTTMTPAWFQHPSVKAGTTVVRHCEVVDDEREQPLHAKAIALVHQKRVRLAFGSANFTTPGLWSTAADGNVEIMIVADDLPLAAADPRRLFDPSGTAADLHDATKLQPAAREAKERRYAPPICLVAASLQDQRLECRCVMPTEGPAPTQMTACLTFLDGGEIRLPLQAGQDAFTRRVDGPTDRHCADGTVVVHIEAMTGGAALRSNRVLLVNLHDVESGRGQRRERRIREAQRSAAQFAAMLGELLLLDDTDTLKAFLTHCDIPVIEAARGFAQRTSRSPWEGVDEMRALGERNLRAYVSLHAAALGFCERHLRRVRRHCERASVAGIPNFMHIALAVGNVLRAQVERVLIGLETTETPLSVDDWAAHRGRLGEYLTMFRKVIEVFYQEYVPVLRRRFKASIIREALLPDLQTLADLCAMFLRTRNRVDACCHGKLRVRTGSGRLIEPGRFVHDVIGPAMWPKWSDVVGAGLRQVTALTQAVA